MASSNAARIVFITGANTGIGYETVKALCESSRPYTILLGSRSLKNADDAIAHIKSDVPKTSSTIHPIQIDVVNDESIQAAFTKISKEFGKLDILLNNAGAQFDDKVASGQLTSRQAFNASWDVNVAGANTVTETFVPLLIQSDDARLLFVTSGTSSMAETEVKMPMPINDPPAAGWPKKGPFRNIISYRSTKAGLNMMMREWAKILNNDGVKVFAVAPGFLATGLAGEENQEAMKKQGAGHPSVGGNSLRKVIEGERDADAGKVIRNYSTPIQPY